MLKSVVIICLAVFPIDRTAYLVEILLGPLSCYLLESYQLNGTDRHHNVVRAQVSLSAIKLRSRNSHIILLSYFCYSTGSLLPQDISIDYSVLGSTWMKSEFHRSWPMSIKPVIIASKCQPRLYYRSVLAVDALHIVHLVCSTAKVILKSNWPTLISVCQKVGAILSIDLHNAQLLTIVKLA